MKTWERLENGDYVAKREQGEFRLFKVRMQGSTRWKIRWWKFDHTDHIIFGYRKTLEEAKKFCESTKRWGMVKVKDLLVRAAKDMGWKPIGETIYTLLTFFNHVESELSVDHFPIVAEEEVYTDTGYVAFKDLKYRVIRFKAVFSDFGESQKYKIFPTYIKTKPGDLVVQYYRYAETKSLDDASDYALKYFDVLLAGTKAECCLATGEYEDAEKYTAEYKRLISELCGGRKL